MSASETDGESRKADQLCRTELFLGKPENEKTFMATVPLGRGSSPRDVANACCFLASDEADYLTGKRPSTAEGLSMRCVRITIHAFANGLIKHRCFHAC